jgi:hypothetical protein
LAALFSLAISAKLVSCTTTKNCSRVKNGNFFYFDKVDRHRIEIYRDDTIQTERNSKTGEVIKSKIIWVNSCNYDLLVRVTKNDSISLNKFEIPIRFEITTIKKGFYIFKATSVIDNMEFEVTDTLFMAD